MIGDIILFLKTWWKQNVTCYHEYVYKEYGNIHFEECRKCGRIKNYIGQSMKKIYKKDINKVMPILQALADGKTIQFAATDKEWIDLDSDEDRLSLETLINNPQAYRIKPKVKYRPFKDAEECWNEMQKHQPFGWVNYNGYRINIAAVMRTAVISTSNNGRNFLFQQAFEEYTFIDKRPFGMKVGEQLWKLMKKQMK